MKCRTVLWDIVAIIVFLSILTGCVNTSAPPKNPLADYEKMLSGDIPQNLLLTIYYMDPTISTRMPLSAEDLMGFPETRKIVVEFGELAANFEPFKELKFSILQPAKATSYINARMYYVLEADDFGKLLEVTISQIRGNIFVNGMEIEHNQVFYDLIDPFLTDEARIMYGIR